MAQNYRAREVWKFLKVVQAAMGRWAVGCEQWRNSPLRGLIKAVVTAVRRGETRALPTPAQTKELQELITVTSILLTLPLCFSALAMSYVQFQHKLFRINSSFHFYCHVWLWLLLYL